MLEMFFEIIVLTGGKSQIAYVRNVVWMFTEEFVDVKETPQTLYKVAERWMETN